MVGPVRAATVSGVVQAWDDRRALGGIDLILNPGGRLAFTDAQGRFSFADVPPGEYALSVLTPLRRSAEPRTVRVVESDLDLGVMLIPPPEAGEVEVIGETPFVDKAPQVSAFNLDQEDIVRMPGGLEDLSRTVATLPGVVAESPFTSLLYIRGGDAGETINYLDRIILQQSEHFGGVFTIFNNDLIDEVDFYAGGFPARYVNVLSGVVDVTYRRGRTDGFHGKADVSFISSKLTLEGPIGAKNGENSFLIGLRRSYIDVALRTTGYADGEILVPYFGDYFAKASFRLAPRHRLDVTGLIVENGAEAEEFDDESLADEDPGSIDAMYHKVSGGVRWSFNTSENLLITNDFFVDLDRLEGDVTGTNPYEGDLLKRNYLLYGDVEWITGPGNMLRAGYYASHYRFSFGGLIDDTRDTLSGGNQQFTPDVENKVRIATRFNSTNLGLFVEDELTVGETGLTLLPGLRGDFWDYNDEWTVSPRMAASYAVAEDWSVKASGGYYVQFPLDDPSTAEDYGNPDLLSEASAHAVLGAEGLLTPNMKLRTEAWHKDYDRLIMNPDTSAAVQDRLLAGQDIFTNDGDGYAYGIDVFWQRRSDGFWDAYLSYGLSWVWRHNPLHTANSSWYQPRQDQRHTLSAVLNFILTERWRLGFKFQYASGRPYTPITGWELGPHPITGDDIWYPQYGDINSARFPDNHTLYVRADYRWGREMNWSLYFELMNAYGAENLYSYTYDGGDPATGEEPEREEINQLPVLPVFGINVTF